MAFCVANKYKVLKEIRIILWLVRFKMVGLYLGNISIRHILKITTSINWFHENYLIFNFLTNFC